MLYESCMKIFKLERNFSSFDSIILIYRFRNLDAVLRKTRNSLNLPPNRQTHFDARNDKGFSNNFFTFQEYT